MTVTYTKIAALLACDDCGALIMPTFRTVHDAWHKDVENIILDSWPTDRSLDLQELVERIHAKAAGRSTP